MFSLPQLGKNVPSEAYSSKGFEKHIIDITESSETIQTLLTLIYPVPKPARLCFALIEAVLAAAHKYDLELPIQILKNDLRYKLNIFQHTRLRVWAIACRLRLEDVARSAASDLSLPFNFDPLGNPDHEVLHLVSAGDYFRLRSSCRKKAFFRFAELLKPESEATNIATLDGAASGTTEAAFRTVPYPDVLVRSSNSAEAPAHRCILAAASPVLRDKLASQLPVADPSSQPVAGQHQSTGNDLQVLQLDEPNDILWPLLDICCYPHVQRPDSEPEPVASLTTLPMLIRMMAAAEKYEMIHGLNVLRDRWHALAIVNPLYAFLVASGAGQTALTKDAARLVANLPNTVCTQYVLELENAPALAYHRLLAYYDECQAAVKEELELVKVRYGRRNRTVPVPPATPGVATREPRWSLHAFLDRMGDSSTRGADGIIDAARSLPHGYIRWRSFDSSLSPGARQEAKDLDSLSQSLPMRLEKAIQKVELKL